MAKMPNPLLSGRNLNKPIADLIKKDEERGDEENQIGKFVLPHWQRDSVWETERRVSFVESIWLGFHLGSIVVTDFEFKNDELTWKSDLLLDGQQRLRSVELYLNDEFKVFNYYWSDLERPEQRMFMNTPIATTIIDPTKYDEEQLADIYDRLNFGGVPHKESERASLKVKGA